MIKVNIIFVLALFMLLNCSNKMNSFKIKTSHKVKNNENLVSNFNIFEFVYYQKKNKLKIREASLIQNSDSKLMSNTSKSDDSSSSEDENDKYDDSSPEYDSYYTFYANQTDDFRDGETILDQ